MNLSFLSTTSNISGGRKKHHFHSTHLKWFKRWKGTPASHYYWEEQRIIAQIHVRSPYCDRNKNRKSHAKKAQRKGSVNHRWNIQKISGRDQCLRTSTLIRDRSDREGQGNLQGESDGSSPTPFQDSSWHDWWSKKRFLVHFRELHTAIKWNPESAVHAERRIISYSTKIYGCDQNYSYEGWMSSKRSASMIIGNIDGSRDLSDPWTGFTQFTLLEEKPPYGYMWSGGRLTRKQLTSRPDHLWPELWKSMGKHCNISTLPGQRIHHGM